MAAYPTGANLNALLLQQLNFRAGGNTPISSLYTLYANGQGQTYWSNSVNPSSIATLSTNIGNSIENTYIELSTQISESIGSSFFSSISSFVQYTYSSISTLFFYQNILLAESTNLNEAFLSTANSFQIQLNSYYQSTTNSCVSTVNSLGNISSYTGAVSQLESSTKLWLSTMSTGIGLQDATTSTLLIRLINYGLYSTSVWTGQQISSVILVTTSQDQFGAFSTFITEELLSTSAGLTDEIEITNQNLFNDDIRISTLEIDYNDYVSTGVIYQISSIFSTNIYAVNQTISSLYYDISSIDTYLANFSTIYEYDISCLVQSTNANTVEIAYLSTQFAYITTSSILEGIYSSFIELEQYTVSLINSTNAAYVVYLDIALSTQTSTLNYIVLSTATASLPVAISTITYITISTVTSTTTNVVISTVTGETNIQLSTLTGQTDSAISSLANAVNNTQFIQLNNTTFTGTLDFTNYQNFVIQVSSVVDTPDNPYYVSFNPTSLSSINVQQGSIMLDINTSYPTPFSYTQNNGLLALNLNQSGLIINSNYSSLPSLNNSWYRMAYNYNVYSGSVYATMTNIWPTQIAYDLQYNGSLGTFTASPGDTPTLSWAYTLWNAVNTASGANAWLETTQPNAFFNIDVTISSFSAVSFGLYPYTQTNATIIMPGIDYYPPTTGNVTTTISIYIAGEAGNVAFINSTSPSATLYGFTSYP